jgi:hypothetical protein
LQRGDVGNTLVGGGAQALLCPAVSIGVAYGIAMREIQLNRHQKSRVINSQQLLLTRNSRPEGRGGSEDNSFVIRICWM